MPRRGLSEKKTPAKSVREAFEADPAEGRDPTGSSLVTLDVEVSRDPPQDCEGWVGGPGSRSPMMGVSQEARTGGRPTRPAPAPSRVLRMSEIASPRRVATPGPTTGPNWKTANRLGSPAGALSDPHSCGTVGGVTEFISKGALPEVPTRGGHPGSVINSRAEPRELHGAPRNKPVNTYLSDTYASQSGRMEARRSPRGAVRP